MESFSVAHRRWFLALILMRVLFSSKGPQPQLAMFRTTSTCGNATCSAAAQGGLLRVSLFLLHRDRSVRDSCASTCSSSFCASHGDSFPSVSSTSRGTTKYIPAKLTAVWLLVKLHLQERGAGGSRAPIIENCWKSENCWLNPRITTCTGCLGIRKLLSRKSGAHDIPRRRWLGRELRKASAKRISSKAIRLRPEWSSSPRPPAPPP